MSSSVKPRGVFWGAAILFLLWNLIGCGMYLADVMMSDAGYAEVHGEALFEQRGKVPSWSMAGYAIAVWSGLLAAILFLLRKRFAAPLFILSLVAAIIGFIWPLTNADYKAAAGSLHWVMPLIVVVIGIVEVLVSRKNVNEGVLS